MSKGKTKLTLSIDTEAVQKGKKYSRLHKQSLSSMVQRQFYNLPGTGKKKTPIADSLIGIIKLKKGETIESVLMQSIKEKHLR